MTTTQPKKKDRKQWIASVGDPFSGLTLYGPFDDPVEAHTWASNNIHVELWIITSIENVDPRSITFSRD